MEVGTSGETSSRLAEVIDLGDRTLLPGRAQFDAHIHLFLHPGAENLQDGGRVYFQNATQSWPRWLLVPTHAGFPPQSAIREPRALAQPTPLCGTRSMPEVFRVRGYA